MADPIPTDRFKAEMPQIPGVSGPGARRPAQNPALRIVAAAVVVLFVGLVLSHFLLRSKAAPIPVVAAAAPAPPDVPPPVADPSDSFPRATKTAPGVATLADMEKPWSSRDFFFVNASTQEEIPALLIRLPGGATHQSDSYWAIAMKSPYGRCQFEYLTDIAKLRHDYGYAASHPMVGNPCTHSLFDPLKRMNILGDVWVRGAVVQGSDLRPPLGILIQVQGKTILAIKMES
jgi:hypothetical protein